MTHRIIEFSLRNRGFVILATIILALYGVYAATRLPLDAVPDITNTQVQINTAVSALAPEEIEKLVTAPIEIEMGGIENLEEVRSISKSGLSQVTLVFKDGTDLYRARQLAGERLQSVIEQLPPNAIPKLSPITTGLGEIYHYTLRRASNAAAHATPNAAKPENLSPEAGLRSLKLIQDYIIKPALRTVPGVAEVNTSGGYDKQITITPAPERLAAYGITLDDVARAISANTTNAGGSSVEKGAESITVRSAGRVAAIADIAALPLRASPDGVALRVGDISEVVIASAMRTGAATHNGEEAVIGSALMLIGQNSRAVAARVHAKIAELRAKLPPGVEIETLYDRTALVDRTITTVRDNLLEGALLVIAVLVALLGNWRAALIVAAAIPLSLLFAISGMERHGIPGNLMSLGAVDFGLIVDGAVVMAENIVRVLARRQRELGRVLTPGERHTAVLEASRQVAKPTLFGVAIITIVYLPLFSLAGVEGKTFTPMAFTVVLALAGALILALTLVPALASLCLTAPVRERESILSRAAKAAYTPVLRLCLRWRWLPVLPAAAIITLAAWIFPKLGAEFIPQLDEGDFAAQVIRTTSIGLGASLEMQAETEKFLLENFPEVRRVFSRIGTSEVATDPMGVNVGDTYILLHPRETWRRADGSFPPKKPEGEKKHSLTASAKDALASFFTRLPNPFSSSRDGSPPISKDALASLMSTALARRFPAQTQSFSQPIELRFNELLSGSRADIAIKVFGDDHDVLERIAGEIREIVEKIPGAADVEFDAAGRAPVLQITMDRPAMLRHNVHADAVNTAIATAYAGADCGVLVEESRRFPIVTRLPDEARRDFNTIARLLVRNNDGGLVPLGRVAKISVVENVNTINREAFRRRMSVQINLRGRDIAGFVAEAREKIASAVPLPEGYTIEYGGSFKNFEEARARLVLVVPAALALIFILIHAAFGRIRQALIVYTGIPLAVTGGVLALWLREMPFSISAGIGFIALSGVAALNGVMMLSFINQLRAEGLGVRAAIEEGALTRLRPVLMTALVASLGFVPMATATGAGAEVQRPLATVVIGGIITATFLTLLLLPAIYSLVEKDKTA
ncbi:MAG: CusA/CzcA family heavy metal efflux RND transporter [Puniceicoccales bacterium]|jgi:cobalt-zinc-cadmium resistance protein CzcA|nr:CusA/CzcA family heavy metal efflux RND transporter [Puniceicoccales bacterium]